jgi:hypothetical protein
MTGNRLENRKIEVRNPAQDTLILVYHNLLHYVHLGINLLKPTCYVMHQQFNIQQLYVLPKLYLCVLYLSEDKQRLVPLTA